MIRLLSQLAHDYHRLLFPPICVGCNSDISPDTEERFCLCEGCRGVLMPPRFSTCPRCAAPAPPTSIEPGGCIHCSSTQFHFQRLTALGVYEGRLQQFVLRMKQASQESLCLAVGRMLAAKIRDQAWSPRPECVAPIPMHWWRRLRRGMNPAALLAEAVAGELRLPLLTDLGRVSRNVPRQSTLLPSRRRRNMRNVFHISTSFNIRDVHVLVIDDVLTTGATVNAFSLALREAGAASVAVGVVARGIGVD